MHFEEMERMRITSFLKRAAAVASLSGGLTLALYAIEYPSNASWIAASSVASISASLVIVYSISMARRSGERREFDNEISGSLSAAIFYNSSGIPLQRSIEMSVGAKSLARQPLLQLARRIELGQRFHDAFFAIPSLAGSGAFGTASTHSEITIPAIGALVALRAQTNKAKAATLESSVQKYSTVGMFLAVILPSFVLFSFMGSSVLLNSASGSAFLYPVLVCALPAAYALCSMIVLRRLNG